MGSWSGSPLWWEWGLRAPGRWEEGLSLESRKKDAGVSGDASTGDTLTFSASALPTPLIRSATGLPGV